MHWAVEMGMRLLEERHAAAQGAAAAAAGAGPSGSTGASSSAGASAGAGKWRDWVACLPERVVTPLEMSEDQVARLGVPYTIRVSLARSRAGGRRPCQLRCGVM